MMLGWAGGGGELVGLDEDAPARLVRIQKKFLFPFLVAAAAKAAHWKGRERGEKRTRTERYIHTQRERGIQESVGGRPSKLLYAQVPI